MNLDSQVKLGQSTSLLAGYKGDIFSVPSITSTKPALYEKPVIIKSPDYDAKWSWPTITLHENVEDLLSAVFQIKLRPVSFEDKPSEGGASAIWPSGALILAGSTGSARQKALTNLSSQLGIDLLSGDLTFFALVRRSRKIGKAIHPCYERGIFGHPDPDNTVRPDTLAALKSLEKLGKTSTDVSMDGANEYLNFYKTYGSHFVSSIDAGDSIFQVFAFAEKDFNRVSQVYRDRPGDLSGPTSFAFVSFTTPRNKAGYGYTSAIGNICIASGDPEMATSLKDGLWLDETYAKTNSIFAPYLRQDAINVNTTFKKITAISFELASLGIFAEYYRMLIWRRVFKGAMYAKYVNGSGVAPYFSNNCPYDLSEIYKDSDPIDGDGFLSTLATPSVNIWQEKIDLNMIALQFPELVTVFSVFASGIQISTAFSKNKTTIDVPGSSNVTLLGHIISSGKTGPIPPTLRLTDSAFKEIKNRLFCGEFYGGARITNADGSKNYVLMNGLMFEENEGTIAVVRDVRVSPSMEVLTERLPDIQLALVAAEARLNFLLANTSAQGHQSLELIKRFLSWLAEIAGKHDQMKIEQLAALEARALYLITVTSSNNRGDGVPIPYLRYKAYKDVVNNVQNVIQTASDKLTDFQNQIRERKAEEREIDRETALNKNIISSGNLLQDYIGTQARYQQSMHDMFSNVITNKEVELDLATKQAEQLNTSLNEQRIAVDDAVIKYQDAVADWQKKETLKAAIDIASNIFALDFAFVTPSSSISALTSLGKKVQKVQKAVKVFDAVIKAYRSIKALPSNPQHVVSTLKDIGPSGLDMPSPLEWDEMKVNFDATLSSGPDIGAKKTLCAAFSILVLRGKALLQSQNIIQETAADLSAAKQRMTLHNDQKKRLDDLKVNLTAKPEDLDVVKIDLIGLSGQLLLFQRQMLMTLTSTVMIQDRALQYEYLRPPTPVGSFTMLNLQLAILNQSQNINKGLMVQPQPAEQELPIIYEIHGVKPENITNNQRLSFDISINKREFASYNYVRVKSVQVEIGGIASTKSGKYYTHLVFNGNPFFDRDFNGEVLEFQTTSRIFTGLHKVSSSRHEFSDVPNVAEDLEAYVATTGEDPFRDNISDITPFSKWQISLPKTQTNKDIKFDDHQRGVTVRLIFRIYAQLNETNSPSEIHRASLLRLERGNSVRAITKTCYKLDYTADAPAVTMVTSPAPTLTESVTKNDVLKMMSGKSVCAGWDVVFSMTAKEVNRQLQKQYDDRLGNPKFMRSTGNIVTETKTSEGMKTKTEFNFTFDAPRLEFLLNNSSSAQIFLPIMSGHYEYSIFLKESWILVSKADVKKTDESYIVGDVPLAILPGSVPSQHNVVIKLNGGAFSAQNFHAAASNPMLSTALTDYFTHLKGGYEVYNFGTLDFQKISVLKCLTPTKFKFNVYHTNSNRDLLQLFIATDGRLQSATSLCLLEPIPSQYESSLIVNSMIFFGSVLPTSLGDGGIGMVLKGIAPTDDGNKDKTWSCKATAGSLSAPYQKTLVSSSSYSNVGLHDMVLGTIYTEDYIKVYNDEVVLDLVDMTFEHGDERSGWEVKVDYNVSDKSYDFEYGSRRTMPSMFSNDRWSSIEYSSHSLKVNLHVSSNLPIIVSGSGQNQLVEIDASPSSVDLAGNLEPPAGACKRNDRELQKTFLDMLRNTVRVKLTNMFNHKFESVSLFALQNLLFPAKNLIDMKEAYVPGDMIVFGNFTS